MIACHRPLQIVLATVLLVSLTANATAANKLTRDKSSGNSTPVANAVAAEVDALILADLERGAVKPVGQCNDEDFLRRASLDITGQLPSPRDVTLFVLDPDPAKRTRRIELLIASPEFGKNWARYWRDVIYMAATDPRSRVNQAEFETWMAEQWNKGTGWNETTTAMLTALGDVNEHPETALIFAHAAETEDVAAEACRIFLGIQMQCANCHDHPSDIWKREQFHELAAYFPRISRRQMMAPPPTPNPLQTLGQTQPPRQPQVMRLEFEIASVNTERNRGDFMRDNPEQWVAMLDRNRDGKVTKQELKGGPGMLRGAAMPAQFLDRLFELGDTDKDDALTLAEVKAMPQPAQQRRGSTEHHMPDLKDPSSKGKLVQPKFFIDGSSPGQGLSDLERRSAAATAFTSPDNPWFARAIVNRVWCEMLGEGFYMPVDDLGPTRSARFPEALEEIRKGFVANAYDPKWLIRTVANSQTYQRKVAAQSTAEDALPFASVTPTRLRADVVYNSLLQVLGINEQSAMPGGGMMMGGPRPNLRSPRFGFDSLFGIDPSVPKEDITGNVPQSLFLMNSNLLRGALNANGNSRLGRILRDNKDDQDALSELYLAVLAREPSRHEVKICETYLKEVTPRSEAYEDLMWSLLNSSEFLSKR